MSLSAARDKLKAAVALQGSASAPRLQDARVLTGGEVVAVDDTRNRPATAALRREASALHQEKGGSRAILHQFELERISISASSSRPRLASAPSVSEANLLGRPLSAAPLLSSSTLPSTRALGPSELQNYAYDRILRESMSKPVFNLSDASGLRISKPRAQTAAPSRVPASGLVRLSGQAPATAIGGKPIPVSTPSNRSEAIRLGKLLDSLLEQEGGGWEEQCQVYDSTFAEACLQVANHCTERGELLQRIRKFYLIVMRSEREARDMARKAREDTHAAREAERLERERADRLEQQRLIDQQKLDALRGGMVRLKMLRAIHGRKLLAAEFRIKELEKELASLKAELANGEEDDELEALLNGGAGGGGRRGRRKGTGPNPGNRRSSSSGVDLLAQQLEQMKNALAEKDEQLANAERDQADMQMQLNHSDQEVNALVAGIQGGTGLKKRHTGGQRGGQHGGQHGGQDGDSQDGSYSPGGTYYSGSGGYGGENGDQHGGQHGGGGQNGGQHGGGQNGGQHGGGPMDNDALIKENKKLRAQVKWYRGMIAGKSGGSNGAGGRNGDSDGDEYGELDGLIWVKVEGNDPPGGAELVNEALSTALLTKTEFTAEEFAAFKVTDLRPDHYVVANGPNGSCYYKPVRQRRRGKGKGGDADGRGGAGGKSRGSSKKGRGRKGGGDDDEDDDDYYEDDGNGGRRRRGRGDGEDGGGRRRGRGGGDDDDDAGGRRGRRGGGGSGSDSDGGGGGRGGRGGRRGSVDGGDEASRAQRGESGGWMAGADNNDFQLGHRKRKRVERKRMVISLKGAKATPKWMCFKLAGTLMQTRVEYEKDMQGRISEAELEGQDFGEFIEDSFVQMYGNNKKANDNLRDFIKGVKVNSEAHKRLKNFRVLTGIVPGDDLADVSVSVSCAAFYRVAIRVVMDIATDDHMIKMRGAAFWAHYAKADCVRLSVLYFEKAAEKLRKIMTSFDADSKKKPSYGDVALDAKMAGDAVRGFKSFEAALNDFMEGKLPDNPDHPAEGESKAKVFEYGDANLARASSKGVKTASRIDVDCFLERALDHWTLFEILEEDQLVQAFGSWDSNGDGNLELDEFTTMVKFANPGIQQKKITRAFVAASGGDGAFVDKTRLASALLVNGLKLADKPSDLDLGNSSDSKPEGIAAPDLHQMSESDAVLLEAVLEKAS